ncbi:hypothetical protein B6V01_003725 [Methanosarcinales archaeon ex4572_44]|nr:MAG: hypothetical protein B6V01_003725 [Methanosarcinales archaeon ex4572_44]RLG26420.1 MAG: hypothetical protein DRN85_03095 [Methanosarcinales archaeon]
MKKCSNELKRRRLLQKEDTIILDKGYCSYNNYFNGIVKFKIIPLIFLKKKLNMKKILGNITYPLSIFDKKNVNREKHSSTTS